MLRPSDKGEVREMCLLSFKDSLDLNLLNLKNRCIICITHKIGSYLLNTPDYCDNETNFGKKFFEIAFLPVTCSLETSGFEYEIVYV